MREHTRAGKYMQASLFNLFESLKNRFRQERLFWKTSIKKERLGAIAVFVAIGAVGSIVYTVINLIF